MTDIFLCFMPFAAVHFPALGLELLKAGLARSPYSVKVRYFSLLFAEHIGYLAYAPLTNEAKTTTTLTETCEWLFAADVFGADPGETQAYVENILRARNPALRGLFQPEPEWFIELALAVRKQVAPFLEACLDEIETGAPLLVGFSCKSQQTMASLALARRIKQRWPETFIVFGGAACDGIQGVELVRQFNFVDTVVSGWGDAVFPEIVRRVMEDRPVNGMRGVYTRGESLPVSSAEGVTHAPGPDNLDSLPYPDFNDYLAQVRASNLAAMPKPFLALETARGCWWADKATCTFCGANGARTGGYSAKSPARALAEIEHFLNLYPDYALIMADNALSADYFDTLFPALARRENKVSDIFYEVRATITKEQLFLLWKAGVTEIQPGIESLNTELLRLMHKGTTMMQNLQCLKWGQEIGLKVRWNLLCGFPGESPVAYAQMAELVPLITHLSPPLMAAPIAMYRFSPLFEQSPQSGVTVKPSPVYAHIYPFDGQPLSNLATKFFYEYTSPQPVEEYTRSLRDAVEIWREVHSRSQLVYTDDGESLKIYDQRPASVIEYQEYTGLQRLIYLACDEAQHVSRLQKLAARQADRPFSAQEVKDLLQPMLDNKIMLKEGQRFFSLATKDTIMV
jgi:ribosomal peptide maturation radical SAM protein 1